MLRSLMPSLLPSSFCCLRSLAARINIFVCVSLLRRGAIIERSRTAVRRFTVSADPMLHPHQHAMDAAGNPIPDAERFAGDEDGTVSIDIPGARVATPAEGARVGPSFEVTVSVLHSDPDAFRKHFLGDGKKMGLVALALDGGDFFAYSINDLDYYPR